MTRKCFLSQHDLSENEVITLPRETGHHLESVLRCKPGDSIEIRDGAGTGWKGIIESLGGGSVQVRLLQRQTLNNESPLELTLALGYSRSEKMDQVIRQATELGVRRIAVFRARRSQYGLKGDRVERKGERWGKIAREALCQCGRAVVPEIHFFQETKDFLKHVAQWDGEDQRGLRILALESAAEENMLSLWHLIPACAHAVVVVGPEGGWSDEEIGLFSACDFHFVHLGPRILRLETAALAVVSCVQLLWGDFGEELGRRTNS